MFKIALLNEKFFNLYSFLIIKLIGASGNILRKKFALLLVAVLIGSMFFSLGVTSASSNQIYWGAWVGENDRMPLSTIQAFENQVGKGMSIWNWMQWWTGPTNQVQDPNFNSTWMNECRNAGMIPMISWGPSSVYIAGVYQGYDDILSGKWDAYLDAWGNASAAWGHPYFVRFYWEFNAQWVNESVTPWSYGMTPAKFVAMWQYVVNRVRAAGGTNISWIWCPAALNDSVSTLQSLYPGDQYVDWVGTDVYPPDVSSGFGQGVNTELNSIRAVAPSKPVMLCEIGNLYGDTENAWWADTLTNTLPNEYAYIKAVCLWQEPDAGFDVTSPSDTLAAFKTGIESNYYSSNVYSSLNTSPIEPLPNTTSLIPSWITSVTSLIVLVVVLAVTVVTLLIYRRQRNH